MSILSRHFPHQEVGSQYMLDRQSAIVQGQASLNRVAMTTPNEEISGCKKHAVFCPECIAEYACSSFNKSINGEGVMRDPLQVQEGGSHYKDMKIQPVEYIHANAIPFIEGNVIKYVSRWRAKNGLQDLQKARHFLDILIELESEKEQQ